MKKTLLVDAHFVYSSFIAPFGDFHNHKKAIEILIME